MDNELKNMLRHEVIDKGRAATAAFGMFAIFTFFYCFNCVEYAWLIKTCSVLIVINSLVRLKLIANYRKNYSLNNFKWNRLRFTIWFNMLAWSVLLNVAAFELKFTGIHFIVVTTILCGFVSSSLITLSPDMTLFIPFQVLMLGPQIFIMLYDVIKGHEYGFGPLIPVYLMYLAYQFKQVKDFRAKLIDTYKYQRDLKITNLELQSSQETQTEQTVKLIHTSRLAALGEMAAGIAHEVNNPLAIISGSLQQLERKINRKEFTDTDALLKHTERSQQSIERITKIINGLRLFSQQSDTLPKVKVNLNEIIHDTLNFCSEMLKARYVRLEIGDIPQALIECHPVQISQVLINLIKNAEDALSEEDQEKSRWVKIHFKKHESNIAIHVINGGMKIPKDVHEKLFLPFFTTKGVGKGTGLGLSISKGIMVEHGGDLVFNDGEAQTTFTIILPTAKESSSPSPQK